MVLLSTALAGLLTVQDGELATVPLDTVGGVMVELPHWVRVVTPSDELDIEPVKSAEGGVKHLQVTMKTKTSKAESVTFALSDGRRVSLRFVPSSGADRYMAVRFPEPIPAAEAIGFLGGERRLMAAMFVDDPFRRAVVNEVLEYEEYPELQFRLVRRHTGPGGLLGYTFLLTNLTEHALVVHPEVLSVGYPNRASLVQVDHEQLVSCDDEDGPTIGTEVLTCATVLRMVVHGTEGGLGGTSGPEVHASSPFIMVQPKKKKGKKK